MMYDKEKDTSIRKGFPNNWKHKKSKKVPGPK